MSTTGTPRHFLSIDDFSYADLRGMLNQAGALKQRLKDGDRPQLLKDKVLAMIFERQSTRTRVSFDVGMRQLGGETIMLSGQEMQLSREETLSDTAKVLSRYVDAITAYSGVAEPQIGILAGLAASYARAGDQERASDAADRLLSRAPAFSATRFVQDRPFVRTSDAELLLQGLQLAGLPS